MNLLNNQHGLPPTSVFTSAFSCSQRFSQVDKFQEQMGSVRYLELDTVLGEGPKAGGALAEAAGQPHSLGDTSHPCPAQPHTWGQQRAGLEVTLLPQSCPHSPAPTKLSTQRDRLPGHSSNSSCTQESPGILFPWFNHVPVPWQDSVSLSLSFCCGEAAQGAQTQL